jgi:4-amino-4-deoxy-L-arabinose transferase-like glycosyltransferase
MAEISRRKRIRNIFGYFLLYAAFLWWGYSWLQDVNNQGFYNDYKHGFRFAGNEARLTAYLMVVFSVCGMIYTGIALVRAMMKDEPPNQAL